MLRRVAEGVLIHETALGSPALARQAWRGAPLRPAV
jgi:hypothetical protein